MQTAGDPTLSPTLDLAVLPARRSSRRTALTTALALGIVSVLGACGGSDGDSDDSDDNAAESVVGDDTVADETADEATDDEATEDEATDDAAASDAASAEDVAACLDEAGYATVSNAEQLSEQQVADLETAFGQVDGLTFDAATTGFAGGIQFFSTAEQAQERADQLGDASVELRPVGSVLISVGAGNNYEDAVSAAESCLS